MSLGRPASFPPGDAGLFLLVDNSRIRKALLSRGKIKGAPMKKTYEKPVLNKRERLSTVVAIAISKA
jgi:hypothetical protein